MILEISLISFLLTLITLIIFTGLMAKYKWRTAPGKIFTAHLITKVTWFTGIYLTSLSNINWVLTGSVLFTIGSYTLGYTMLLFFVIIYKGEKYFKDFLKKSLIISALFFLSFTVFKPFTLLPEPNGYYFKLTNYFFYPALALSLSYYLVIILFYYLSKKKESKDYKLFATGLLIHTLTAHAFVIMEFILNIRHIIINAEFTSLIGFSIALYAFAKINK